MTKTGNGISEIDETDNYKYLGVYLSRNLKPTHHILNYLKENLENKLNGMVRILGKHGEFNRVEFGNALWTSVRERPFNLKGGGYGFFPKIYSDSQCC